MCRTYKSMGISAKNESIRHVGPVLARLRHLSLSSIIPEVWNFVTSLLLQGISCHRFITSFLMVLVILRVRRKRVRGVHSILLPIVYGIVHR
jgi:EamA domain-containing membrane protein RarD